MISDSSTQKSPHACFQCGSPLIFVSEETVQLDGSRFQQTNSVYRCSNVVCQKKKDQEKAERLEVRQKQAKVVEKRAQKMQGKQKKNLKLKH